MPITYRVSFSVWQNSEQLVNKKQNTFSPQTCGFTQECPDTIDSQNEEGTNTRKRQSSFMDHAMRRETWNMLQLELFMERDAEEDKDLSFLPVISTWHGRRWKPHDVKRRSRRGSSAKLFVKERLAWRQWLPFSYYKKYSRSRAFL